MAEAMRLARTYRETAAGIRQWLAAEHRHDRSQAIRAGKSGARRPRSTAAGDNRPVWPGRDRRVGHTGGQPPTSDGGRRSLTGMAVTRPEAWPYRAPAASARQKKRAVEHRNGRIRAGRPDMPVTHRQPLTRSGGEAPKCPPCTPAWPSRRGRCCEPPPGCASRCPLTPDAKAPAGHEACGCLYRAAGRRGRAGPSADRESCGCRHRAKHVTGRATSP